VIRSLKVEIMEGRDLLSPDIIRRSSDPYTVITLNQIKTAKTVVKLNSVAPFWGESFFLESVFFKTPAWCFPMLIVFCFVLFCFVLFHFVSCSFSSSDIHPKINSLTLYVNSQSRIRIQKDSEIGKLHFSFEQLPRNKQIEEWFNLAPVTAGENEGAISPKESDLGAIRVKITLIVSLSLFFPPCFSQAGIKTGR